MTGYETTASRVLENPTGQELADEPAGSRAALSHGQRSLWFLHHLAPVGGAYNIAAAARALSPMDAGTLERAFQALLDRHAALRTTFPAVDGAPHRQVAGHLDFALACRDVTGWSAERLRSHLAAEAWRPFDLEHGPLLRVSLFTGDPGGPVILLVIHHVVADFWSLAILMRELPALYREAAGMGPADLPAPGAAYHEHVRLEQEALAGERGEELLAWWRERLAGLPALELATDRPRPAVQTYRGDTSRLRLPGELAAALRARSRAQRGTLFMTLIAAFEALLGRHTGQEDLSVGAPRAGRWSLQFAGTVGYFVNPVVLRGDLSGDPTFLELLERTRATVIAAFEHGDYPLPLLAEHLQPERDASRTPLFQVSFVLQKETRGAEGLTAFALGEEGVEVGPEDFRLESLSLQRPPSPFDLMLHAVERQGGLSFALQYNADLFDATTAARLLERFATLLRSVAESPDLALSALPLLPEAECHQLLCAWNDTAGAGSESTLFELFAAQAERTPDSVAVVASEEQITYRELKERAAALARHLAGLGVGPEVLVGVAAERSAEMVVGLLAVLGAGGAYLPLEPDLPRQRLALILEDARPAVLLTHRSRADALPLDAAPGARLAWLDSDASPPATHRPLSRPAAGNAAYVIYTSGSTGRPKGVVNSHRGILNRLLWMQEAAGLDAGDRFLQKTPFGFDVSVPEFFAPLLLGARLVMARPEGHRDSAYLVRLVQQEGITTIHFVPSMLPFFLAEEGAARCRSLRRVLVSGEALPWEVEQRCLTVLPVPLINLYGPTEAAVEVTAWTCETAARPRPVPIGRPIRNTRIHVVGRRLEPAPPGAVGELAIGGVQVARGYFGRPDLTAERFVPDPFGPPGARLYRTGDLCRHLQRGEIEYLGRLDDQVKIRGFRIEPREIEIALAAHPQVREAAVVLRQANHQENAERSLLACVVLREAGSAAETAAVLRDFLAARLPSYMVPAFAFGDALDRLPNGKLDRRALARWMSAAEPARQGLAPRTPHEELLAGLFAEVLGAERIGLEDDFFEQGGHSLAAMRLIARVRETLGVDLPLSRVFETPTVAALAGAIAGSARSEAPPLVPVSRDTPLPLSFAQQRLWLLHQLEPASPVYNMPARVEISGQLDRAALAAALAEVVRRHEALRTAFRELAGEPVQIIAGRADFTLPLIDLQDREEVDRLIAAEARRPFDLRGDPLLRALLLRLGAGQHVLLLTMHHIVSDGWSLGVLVRELGPLYTAFRAGRPSPLPDLPIQPADFAVWQRRFLSGEVLEAELAWWRGALAGVPAALALPADHPPLVEHGAPGAVHDFTLDAEGLAGLAALSRRHGTTLFMTLLAGFAALLQRFTGADDLAVGTPVAGRTRVETEPLIGLFVNTLVLRTDLAGDPDLVELLARVRETTLAAYAHQEVPFERLVEELVPERDASRSPLVQVLLALQNAPSAPLDLPELTLAAAPVPTGRAKLELTCTFTETEQALTGTFEYRRDLFDRATVLRLADGLARLLASAVAAPRASISELSVLAPAEQAALLFEWNDTATATAGAPLVHELVAAQARRQPDALAVAAPGERLAYGELVARAGQLVRLLARLGVGPEARVALCAGATVHRAVGSLAVLLAGGAYVALDPEAPPERLAFLVADSGAAAVLADRASAGRFPATAALLVVIEEAGAGDEEASPLPAPAVDPDHIAYVVYTSGSTGLPKGVAVSHAGLLNLVRWHCDTYGTGPGDRATLIANPAFDAAVWELWPHLAAGASLHIPEEETRLSAQAIVRFWRREGITRSFLPTPLAEEVLAEGDLSGLSLRGLLCGGDRLHRAPGPGLPFSLINHYGPSEASVVATAAAVPPETPGLPPIGRPLPNLRVRVVDARGALTPRGVAGELCLGGVGLARGYLDRPALTAERFLPDPWSDEAGARLYRTGDLVRHRADGSLEFLGRIDQQIKLRGFRIEPGEIEAALRRHPGVSEAVVAVHAGRLVAYVVGVDGRVPERRALRDVLAGRLPGYMVPSTFVALPALPLTPNGKLDRAALPAPPESDEGLAPRTPAEELVAGIFAEVLGVERVGLEDDFFALGGHSLLATRVASQVRAVFGVELPVRVVFEEPTVEALAGWIERAAGTRETGAEEALGIARVSRGEPLVLSFAQQRLWFLDQLEPGTPLYNIPLAVELAGPLDVAALTAAFGEVARRHETLRTTFHTVAGEPVQLIAESAGFSLPLIEVHSPEELARLSAEEARRPFDLSRGPLLRALLLRSAAERHVLLLTMHHIVSDGWSMGVLVRELGVLYRACLEGRPSPQPELAIQYPDFAAWQRGHLAGERLDVELAWWRGQLAGIPPALELPADRPRPAVRSVRGATCGFALDGAALAGLTALSRRQGATLFMTLLAGFAGLLERIAGADDLVVGTPIAGRTRAEIEPLIGFFVNTLALRIDAAGDPEAVELLGRVRETTLSAYAHQEVPFERLVEELVPERDPSRPPLVQVMFALQNAPLAPLERGPDQLLPGLALKAAALANGTAKLDLTVVLRETEQGLAGDIEYSRDLFDSATIERWAGWLVRLLAGVETDPRGRLSELPLLSAAEHQQTLLEWNDTATAYPREACLQELFAEVAAARPDAPAIVAGSETWTYIRLDAASSRLARRLRSLGVGLQTPVGLSMERSPELIVAILAILKAGGLYVPLDASYPDERLEYLLEDAGAPVVLVHERTRERLEALASRQARLVDVTGASLSLESLESLSSLSSLARVPAESAAYVIYTSGSTGRPKGVAVPHRAIVRLARDTNYGRLSPGDRMAQVANISFDAATWEIWGALLNGATVVVISREVVLSAAALAAALREQEVTALFLTTALFNRMAREVPEAFADVRDLLFGGEAADPAAARAVLAARPPRRLLHVYGPTESTTYASWHLLREVPPDAASLPIGAPLANTSLYVLDRWLGPAPPGTAGELCIGGDGLAWGYWNRPELTAERFVPNSWEAGGRLYRTGDLVRRPAGGALDFLGRIDQQVKIRGFRIEPGEIEAALLALDRVRSAVVLPRRDATGGLGLVAYVVTEDAGAPGTPEATELRQRLAERLPPFMLPTGWVFLPSLPLTANGKVDRKALAKLAPERLEPGTGAAPRTPTEELVAEIFAEVLHVERVGVTDDFFASGGHSLLATQVAARVRSVFGMELPLRTVFEAPTIEGLAAEIEALRREGSPAERLPLGRIERDELEGPIPLSFAQERLWFLQQLEPGSAAYNMPLELELSGALRTGALAAALAGVLHRHEALRTTFVSIAGELCQRIAPPGPVATLPLVDLSALPEAARHAAADRLAQWHAAQGFDLERGPLYAWLLVRLAGERHRFLLDLHHTIADGWSIHVFARELGELYTASLEGRPGRLPELPIQYADFAQWQRRWLVDRQDEELAYWESRLGGDIASAELPTDRPRPAIQTFRGAGCRRMFSEDLTARLHRFGRAEGITLFMALLAATQALLARHSGEPDVAVGVPVAGRQWAETEGLIGCFLNTLVLRTDLSGQPSFRALADRMRTVTLEAYAHQNVPFEAVLRRLGLRRDLSRTPLFQVLFNLLNLPAMELSLPGVELRALIPTDVPSKLDVTFYVSERDARIGIHLVYNADLFDAARMDDFLAQLELFLDEALETPERSVTGLPLLTPAMRQVLPDPTLALDGSWIGSVYELFAAQAERAPERPAVVDAAGEVQTYGALLAGSRRVAGWLAAQGVRKGDPVAILAVRAAPLVEAVLGVLGAGAAFVMLDSAYPALRQLEMLRLACPRAWISFAGEEGAAPAEVLSWLRETGCPCLELPPGGTDAVAELAAFAWQAPQVRVGPEDVACIGFTSGSTGGPKGILGLHGSLSHFLPSHCRLFDLGPDDRFSLLSGLGHDPLQREIFTPLYLGGTIAVPDPSDYGITGRLAAWLCRQQVTVSHLTPTLGQLLTELPSDGTRELVPSLRRVLLVGESLTRRDVARLRAMAPAVSCVNLYGSTETQRAVGFHRVTPEEAEAALTERTERTERAQQVLPLGRGVPDVQLLVLNPAGGLAGLGELGEIAVRSPHLARGYLGNAELTAQKFQVNPFSGEPADRIYRTGDLGRYRPDGEVVFAGRLDQQVKLRGFRIELGEIEGVLAALPGVQEAAVLLRTDLPGGAGLVAYVRTEEGREVTLRGELEARLPAYMVPAAFVRLDQLPRNANGKLDRRALLRIMPELRGTAELTLPRTPAEELLAGIWSQVLGVEQIGTDQSFFELGGHSLLAAQMASRVRDVFGVELPLRSLFVAPTLAGLAAEIERLRTGAGGPELPTIASFLQDRSSPPPLSFAQERYWAGRHLESLSVASTIPMLGHLAGPLDRACLRRAIAAVVDRHEILRTSFREDPEGPIQVIHPAVPAALPEVDLERLAAAERMAEVRRFSILDGRLHFDYERPPLFRPTLFRCSAEEHILLFTIHHVASDWWSGSVLVREVLALYLAFRTGQPSPLPPLAAQFQDFARWQRRLSAEEAQASQVTFWREHLSGAVPIDLGAGRPRPRNRTFTAGTVEVVVPEELERQLDAFSAQQGVTLFMTLLAAFEALLHDETGLDDLVVPCSFANRNQLETESLIGNLATALPLRTRLSGVRTFRELLQRVRDVTLLAHDHPDIFWEPVVEGMSFLEEGDRGGLTTFRILFQLIKAQPAARAQDASDLRITQLPVDTGRIRLDLSLFLSQADQLAGRFRYNRDVLDQARVVGLRDRFLRILAAVVADPEHPLAEAPSCGLELIEAGKGGLRSA